MTVYHLKLPLSEEDVRKLRIGDSIYVTGDIVTARDDAHKHALELHEKGEQLPVDFSKLAIYHCGPIMKKDEKTGEWKVVVAGPTTSMRMELFQDKFIEAFGTRLIIGKGGMGDRTATACKKFGAIYAMFTGGAAILAADRIKKVKEVHWLDLLGMPECLWVFEVEEFGPLLVAIDAEGNNLFKQNEEVTKQMLPKAYKIVEKALEA